MSFFDLENELPGWLDAAITKHSGFSEIQTPAKLNNLDAAVQNSYHIVCADRGNMVNTGSQTHQIWKFQAPRGNIRTYGKYLEYNGNNTTLQLWIGLVVMDNTMTFYLWFGSHPSAQIRQKLKNALDEEIDKNGYWYKAKLGGGTQPPETPAEYCGYGSGVLSWQELDDLKQKIITAIDNLLGAVEQAV
jgi:hypothetical protein